MFQGKNGKKGQRGETGIPGEKVSLSCVGEENANKISLYTGSKRANWPCWPKRGNWRTR